jgi:hypothetical protein
MIEVPSRTRIMRPAWTRRSLGVQRLCRVDRTRSITAAILAGLLIVALLQRVEPQSRAHPAGCLRSGRTPDEYNPLTRSRSTIYHRLSVMAIVRTGFVREGRARDDDKGTRLVDNGPRRFGTVTHRDRVPTRATSDG